MVHLTSMGRTDESSGIQASQLALTLKNQDGRFTPKNPAGAYYPNIVRNTPIRVSVSTTSVSGTQYAGPRYFGQVASWPPTSDISQHDVYVQVSASGSWQQISQSQANIGSAYTRYLNQLSGTSVPASAWGMEDGSGSTAFVTEVGAGAAATFTGTPSFAADGTSFPGLDALPQFNGARITANVSSGATATSNVVRFALSVPAAGDSFDLPATFSLGAELCKILSPSATGIKRVDVSLVANQLVIHGYGATTGGSALFTGVVSTKVNGIPVLVSVELTPSGGSVNWALRVIKPGAGAVLDQVTGTQGASTIAAVSQVFLDGQGRLADTTAGGLGVFYAVPSLVTAAAALNGFAGEFAVVRFQRLCAEFNIASEVIGSTSAAMGPQVDDTLEAQFQIIENTDGGLLFELRDQFGLGYRTLTSMQNQSPAVTLNYAAGALGAPLAATFDSQLVKNQWTIINWDGYTALATLTSGAVSIQKVPNGVGLYSGQANANANTHAQVNAIAQQRLFQGTVDDIRYPQVTVDFRRSAAGNLFATVPALRVGDYLQITNLPPFEGASTAKQLVYGWDETLNAFTWNQVFNTVPELPFETSFNPGVFSVVAAPQGSTPFGSQVGSSVSGSQIGSGAIPGLPGGTLSARSIGGTTSFIAAATPFDWTFNVSGAPADATYFTATQDQVLPIGVGDTFSNSGGLGGPFTVTSLDPPSGGNVNVHFTPDATSVMSTGSVSGGKNGDTWVNTSAGNQLEIWNNGAWTSVQFGLPAVSFSAGATVTVAATAPGSPAVGDLWYDSSNGYILHQWNGSSWPSYQWSTGAISTGSITAALIAAHTITATQIAAGTITSNEIAANTITASNILAGTLTAGTLAAGAVIAGKIAAGAIDGMTITGANFIATGTGGDLLVYSGTPGASNLIAAISGAAGTDAFATPYASGIEVKQGGLVMDSQGSAPAAVTGASILYNSVGGRPRVLQSTGADGILDRSTSNVGTNTIGNTATQSILSGAMTTFANEAGNSTTYEIQCRGQFTNGAGLETLNMQMLVDGTSFGGTGGGFTLGAAFFGAGGTWDYAISFLLSIITAGSSGTARSSCGGSIAIHATNIQGGGPSTVQTSTGIAGMDQGLVTFNSTIGHTLQIYGKWGGAGGAAQTLTNYQTIMRRID